MTRDDIIRMALDAGILWSTDQAATLERFAALAQAAERDECAKVAENRMLGDASVKEKVAHHTACKNIAQDIRARGQS